MERSLLGALSLVMLVSLSSAGELSGRHLPPPPDGLTERAGACIALPKSANQGCEYAFGVLENTAGVPKVVYAGQAEGRDPLGKAKWLIIDAVSIPSLPSGYRLAIAQCAYDGAIDETIIAAVRADDRAVGSKQWLDEVLWAKRLDLTRRAFVDLLPVHVACVNIGMG